MGQIKMTFRETDGQVKVEAFGFTGPSCKTATDIITKTLGESRDFKRKAEWYETAANYEGNLNSDLCG